MIQSAQPYPLLDLNGRDLASVPDDELTTLFDTGPALYKHGGNKIVRISPHLVIKGGFSVLPSEAANQTFARESLPNTVNIPKVHRVFNIRETDDIWGGSTCYILMDYIHGRTVGDCWPQLSAPQRSDIIAQVASCVRQMQSVPLPDKPPGPIGGTRSRWMGLWFSDYGAGPFKSVKELEDWLNYALTISRRFGRARPHTPDFRLAGGGLVLSHMDIAPRNLMLGEDGKVWLLDWAFAGAFPPGFEQAVVQCQHRIPDFTEALLEAMPPAEREKGQLGSVMFVLSTAALESLFV